MRRAGWPALVLLAALASACATAGPKPEEAAASAFDRLLDHQEAVIALVEESFGSPEEIAKAVNGYADRNAAEIRALADQLRAFAAADPQGAQKVAGLRAERLAIIMGRWHRVVDADPSLFEEGAVKRALARVTPQL